MLHSIRCIRFDCAETVFHAANMANWQCFGLERLEIYNSMVSELDLVGISQQFTRLTYLYVCIKSDGMFKILDFPNLQVLSIHVITEISNKFKNTMKLFISHMSNLLVLNIEGHLDTLRLDNTPVINTIRSEFGYALKRFVCQSPLLFLTSVNLGLTPLLSIIYSVAKCYRS